MTIGVQCSYSPTLQQKGIDSYYQEHVNVLELMLKCGKSLSVGYQECVNISLSQFDKLSASDGGLN